MPGQYDRVYLDSGLMHFNFAPVDTKCNGIQWGNLECGIRAVVEFEVECECGERRREYLVPPTSCGDSNSTR